MYLTKNIYVVSFVGIILLYASLQTKNYNKQNKTTTLTKRAPGFLEVRKASLASVRDSSLASNDIIKAKENLISSEGFSTIPAFEYKFEYELPFAISKPSSLSKLSLQDEEQQQRYCFRSFTSISISPHKKMGVGNEADEKAGRLPPLSLLTSENLIGHKDHYVAIDEIKASLLLNIFFAVLLLCFFELLRWAMPKIYDQRKNSYHTVGANHLSIKQTFRRSNSSKTFYSIYCTRWSEIHHESGLDAYMALRYIHMCSKITGVSSVWGFIILIPLFSSGTNNETGLDYYSMTNLQRDSHSLFLPSVFMWVMTFYVLFCVKKEYQHYLHLRMHYLGRYHSGSTTSKFSVVSTSTQATRRKSRNARRVSYASQPKTSLSDFVHEQLSKVPRQVQKEANDFQHQYSILCEQIPHQLRSDVELYNYFDALFPGKVYAARIVMNIPPDLTRLINLRRMTKQKLKYNIAIWQARSNNVPSNLHRMNKQKLKHSVTLWQGRSKNIDSSDNNGGDEKENDQDEEELRSCRPTHNVSSSTTTKYESLDIALETSADEEQKPSIFSYLTNFILTCFNGTAIKVDSIAYYDKLVAKLDIKISQVQADLIQMASIDGHQDEEHWQQVVTDITGNVFGFDLEQFINTDTQKNDQDLSSSLFISDVRNVNEKTFLLDSTEVESSIKPSINENSIENNYMNSNDDFFIQTTSDGTRNDLSLFSRLIMGLGLDFVIVALTDIFDNISIAREYLFSGWTEGGVTSTGFVTFRDLTSVTCATGAPLTSLPGVMTVSMAPEPRDILWENVRVDTKIGDANIKSADAFFAWGAVFWSVPVVFIQGLATSENFFKIPGITWISHLDGGDQVSVWVNGYLPVVALLVLIQVLPIIFKVVAMRYEGRKSMSNVDDSIIRRFFYYHLANIFVTAAAGSIFFALQTIVDKPEHMFEILGGVFPKMAGFFISFLITKTLAGLPIVLINMKPFLKMLLIRMKMNEEDGYKKTKAAFDAEMFPFGRVYANLILVLVICFTYACISPLLLPFGYLYFWGALLVYKRQALYMYIPIYESGGSMFPTVCSRTLVGLILSQMVFAGNLFMRKALWEAIFVMPAPFLTYWTMGRLFETYAVPGMRLTLERAKDIDNCEHDAAIKIGDLLNEDSKQGVVGTFDKDAYRQPSLRLSEGLAHKLSLFRKPSHELT